jgi:hypothetical protein
MISHKRTSTVLWKSIQANGRHAIIIYNLIALCFSILKTIGKTVKKVELYGLIIILPCKHCKSNLGNPALGYNQWLVMLYTEAKDV